MSTEAKAIPPEVKNQIEDEAAKECIYEPKYGGKDHSGYGTMMLYEVNGEREECFEKGAEYGYNLAQQEIERLKALIEIVYSRSWNAGAAQKQDPDEFWQQFKKDNQL